MTKTAEGHNIFFDKKTRETAGKKSEMFSQRNVEMRKGPIVPAVIAFAIPLILSSLLQLFFNAADMVVVGRFAGPQALAAVGSTGSLIMLMTNVFIGLSVGSSVTVSQAYGAQDNERVFRTVHTALPLAVLGGLLVTVIGECATRFALEKMGSPEDVINLSELYMRIYFIGTVSNMVYNYASAILRAVGDTKRPLIYLSISGVLNVGLNLFFVIVLHMSVAGVAIATVASQTLSAVLTVRCLIKEKGAAYQFFVKKSHIYRNELRSILRIGLPAGIQGSLFSISNVLIQSSINSFGSVVMAGNTAAGNLESFMYAVLTGFQNAALTFVGQNLGARQYKRMRRVMITVMIMDISAAILLGGIIYVFHTSLLSIYNPDPSVIAVGMIRISIVTITTFLCGFMDVFVGGLRGLGKSLQPMLITLVGTCAFRVIWILLVFRSVGTLESVYVSYPISWTITSIFQVSYWFLAVRRFPKEDFPLPEES